ncbi:hypothetical protein ABZU86_11045 [Streptomyces sp. NPDC005271]
MLETGWPSGRRGARARESRQSVEMALGIDAWLRQYGTELEM